MPPSPKLVPKKQPRQERSRETVSAILEATLRLIRAEGLEGLNTNRIAELAGVSVGSLYQCFPSKEALAGALLEAHLAGIKELLVARLKGLSSSPLPEAIRALIESVIDLYQSDPKVVATLETLAPQFGRMWLVHQIRDEVAELAVTLLKRHPREVRPRDFARAGQIVVRALDGVLVDTLLLHPEELGHAEFREELVQLALRYLLVT